jgi:hypothetical protein
MDDADGAAGIGFAISAFAMAVLGRRQWAIAEGYMPGRSTGPAPDMVSHETACILSANDEAARVRLTVYFADHEPAGPYLIDIGARRTLHVRFNDLTTPEPIPKDTDFFERSRVERARRRPAHSSRFPTGRQRTAHHDGIRRRPLTGFVPQIALRTRWRRRLPICSSMRSPTGTSASSSGCLVTASTGSWRR